MDFLQLAEPPIVNSGSKLYSLKSPESNKNLLFLCMKIYFLK